MSTTQVQLKISLSPQLSALLAAKAARFGIPVTQMVKHLIIKDVDDLDYPTYQMTKKTEEKVRKAIADHKAGKTIKLNKVEDLLTI